MMDNFQEKTFTAEKIRKDFPILKRKIHGKPLVYLDNAATSQKPRQVISAVSDYYENHNANVHRGIHLLGDEATNMYQKSREIVARFIGARDANELVFVRNTTEGINLVAFSWGVENVGKDDVILTSEMEHHSNIVPWQELAKRVGARVEFVKVNESGMLDLVDFGKKIKLQPKLVALAHVSNFLGTINPIGKLVNLARKNGAKVLVDGAQAVPHMKVNVLKLGADFYAFSGHKMLGPMGIGGLWVRREILKNMPPMFSGGGMISEVSKQGVVFTGLPDRFDAGTPNVAGAVGLAEACKYLSKIGMDKIFSHEQELAQLAIEELKRFKFIKIYGPLDKDRRGGLAAFEVKGVHAHDVAQILDSEGVAVRSGHHCTMPMHKKLAVAATTRASFALYNTKEDVKTLSEGILKVKKLFNI